MLMDIVKQGARARSVGRPRDACPYPGESRERRAWFEGYDGVAWDMRPWAPHPARTLHGAAPVDLAGGAAAPSIPPAPALG